MFINEDGFMYEGDMIPGDREATEEEVAAFVARNEPKPPTIDDKLAVIGLTRADIQEVAADQSSVTLQARKT